MSRHVGLRPFFLYREDDVHGVSGTGVVAVGVVLPSGRAVMEWQSKWPTVTVFGGIDEIERIHGHGGKTVICWGTPPVTERTPLKTVQRAWRTTGARLAAWTGRSGDAAPETPSRNRHVDEEAAGHLKGSWVWGEKFL